MPRRHEGVEGPPPMTTIIEHPEYGRIEGVKRADGQSCQYPVAAWEKDGALYFVTHGWREVPQGVDVTGIEWKIDARDPRRLVPNNTIYEVQKLPAKHWWEYKRAVVLPEDIYKRWSNYIKEMTPNGCRPMWSDFTNFLIQFSQSVLLIKKEGGG